MKQALLFLFFLAASPAYAGDHAIAMFGEPKYKAGFTHFDYVNPDAPKAGEVKLAAIGTYNTFNSHILKGVPAAGLKYLYDTLMVSSDDEPFTKYGLIAKEITLAPDRNWVEFTLRPEAKWSDGKSLTVEDVIFSFEILTTKGHPFYRSYYQDVAKVEKAAENTVRFIFTKTDNRELPLIIGEMPILPKHFYDKNDFTKTSLKKPIGSGPYEFAGGVPGKWISYRLRENYWAKDLPVNKGRYNFAKIRYDYYRDAAIAVEAFKSGEYDFRQENISKVWANSYDIDAVKDGRIIKEEIPHQIPTGMQAFVFNTRRDKFKDPRVRKAISYAFDFEWTNKNLFYDAYTRTKSYFSNSEFASSGLPEGKELELLNQYRSQLPEEIFTKEYILPATNGSGNNRKNLLKARTLLKESGLEIKNGKLLMEIEFLLNSPSFERVVAPIIPNLKRLGITATMRTVDSAQYIKRMENFDFDIVVNVFGQSNAPGNEQMNYWHSSRTDVKGSRNLAGIKNTVVDALVEKVITATDKESLIASTHALDRVLLHGNYIIPNWHVRNFRIIYWNKFGKPDITPKYDLGFDNWWSKV